MCHPCTCTLFFCFLSLYIECAIPRKSAYFPKKAFLNASQAKLEALRAIFDTDPYISFTSTELCADYIWSAFLAIYCTEHRICLTDAVISRCFFKIKTRLLYNVECHLLVPHIAFSVGTIWRWGYTHEIFLLRALPLCTSTRIRCKSRKWTSGPLC